MPKMSNELSGPLRTMQDMAKRIATVSKEAKIEIDEEQYVQKFKPYMMDIVFEWCKGASFMQICKMTDLFEGKLQNYVKLNSRNFFTIFSRFFRKHYSKYEKA